MIEIADLTVSKHGRTICSVLELNIEPGERVAILGSNGSGKTTLLRVLAGLERSHGGSVSVDAAQRDRGFVHQSPYLFRGTALSNVLYGLQQSEVPRADREQLAREWLNRLGVEKLIDQQVAHFSGGEKRRVALARAMVLQPKLLLLDEPLSDMDDAGAAAVVAALDALPGCTVLVASPTQPTPGLTARDHLLE